MRKVAKWILAYVLGSIAVAVLISCHLNTAPPKMQGMPSMAELISDRVAWPCGLMLTKDTRVLIVDGTTNTGFVVINAGVIVKATGLTADGKVRIEWSGQKFTVPMEDTSIIELLVVPESIRKLDERHERPATPLQPELRPQPVT